LNDELRIQGKCGEAGGTASSSAARGLAREGLARRFCR
jgi:hypothetical protein